MIELIKTNKTHKHINKLQSENKSLRDKIDHLTEDLNASKKDSEKDKELILHLSEKVAKTTSLNLDLASRLKINEAEIESYKKILIDYRNELSEMKVKQLNEASYFL